MELQCPHTNLLSDLNALGTDSNRVLMLDFLVSELLAARLSSVNKAGETVVAAAHTNPYSVEHNLSAILGVYGVTKPPPHITVKMVFDKVIGTTTKTLESVSKDYLGTSLVSQRLTLDQWAKLDRINNRLTEEYSLRRRMLLTRCSVTVQSFRWSDKSKVFSTGYWKRL